MKGGEGVEPRLPLVSELEHHQAASRREKANRDFLSGLQIKVAVGNLLCCSLFL